MKGDKTLAAEVELLEKIKAVLEEGKCARTIDFTKDELELLGDSQLLTLKPIIYVANVSEDEAGSEPVGNPMYDALKAYAESERSEIIAICAGIEAEIAELEPEEKAAFLEDMGIAESGLDRLIKASYSLLGLISYLTAGPKEVRAWTITKGTKAPQAAGKIHSDFERGFIRAEIVSFDDLVKYGSMAAVKEAGLYRSEGKEYVMKDGDIVLFRFNV
jgi:GTP-binding protein YchF